MTKPFDEGGLRFTFPPRWRVLRPARSSFYRRHFQGLAGGCKETDFVAYDPDLRVLWLIEVKDYSVHGRTKSLDIVDEMAAKCRDVLALVAAAAALDRAASTPDREQAGDFWRGTGQCRQLRVALHCELPPHQSKLFPGVRDQANLQQRLRQSLKPIDRKAILTDLAMAGGVGWSVTRSASRAALV